MQSTSVQTIVFGHGSLWVWLSASALLERSVPACLGSVDNNVCRLQFFVAHGSGLMACGSVAHMALACTWTSTTRSFCWWVMRLPALQAVAAVAQAAAAAAVHAAKVAGQLS